MKGFSIGVDVFGKGDRFDPSTDTVVRVQAGRLRDVIDQYYAGEGAGDPLRIAIPRGSYVPDYRPAGEEVVPEPAAAPEEPEALAAGNPSAAELVPPRGSDSPAPAGRGGERRYRALALAGSCLVALLVAVFSYRAVSPPAADTAGMAVGSVEPRAAPANDAGGMASHHLLPSVVIEMEADDAVPGRIAASLRRGLTGFDTVTFIDRPDDEADELRPMEFAFVLKEGATEGETHVELHDRASGRVLLSHNIVTAGREQAAIDDEVANLLTSVAPVSGAIYAGLAEDGVETSLTRCLMLNDEFYRGQTPARHRTAYECFEALAGAGLRSPLVYSEMSSLQVQALTNSYDYPADMSAQAALRLAQNAVKMGPNSPSAHRAMGYVMSRAVGTDESIRWTRKAYELNTFDLGMAASYGYALVFAGDYEQGTPVLRRAVTSASSHAMWWDYGLFLGEFMLGDLQAATRSVSALAASRRAHYVAARLIAADLLGRDREAAAALAELQAGHSVFAADPEAFYERGNYPADMAERLVRALRRAGLAGAS